MQGFTFYNPTKIIFGKNEISRLPKEIPPKARILILYGGGSIKQNGVYDQVQEALKSATSSSKSPSSNKGHHVHIEEFGGIEANPTYETLMKAVNQIRQNKLDFLLAVGGGSVIDGTKFIAAAANFEGNAESSDPWDILTRNAPIKNALPFGTILTLPATGSEMNSFAVITRDKRHKLAFAHPTIFPKFSILDPTTTFSLPPRQLSNGVVDAFTHTMEQYLTYPVNAPLQDRLSESILQTLIEEGPKTINNPQDYDARANVMWCATMALNGLIGCGVPQDWSTHRIGHEITALYGLDHAQTLAIILPAVMSVKRKQKRQKILQYGQRVWGMEIKNPDDIIDGVIGKTRQFFERIGNKTKLRDYKIGEEAIPLILKNLEEHDGSRLGEHGDIDPATTQQILREAL